MEEKTTINIKQSTETLDIMVNHITKFQSQLINQLKQKHQELCLQENRKKTDTEIIDECTTMTMAFACKGFDPSIKSYAFALKIQKITVLPD